MDYSEKDSGQLVGHMGWRLLSPFDLSRIFSVGGSLSVPHSLLGPPVVKITHVHGYYLAWPGRAVSVSGFPNKTSLWALGGVRAMVVSDTDGEGDLSVMVAGLGHVLQRLYREKGAQDA